MPKRKRAATAPRRRAPATPPSTTARVSRQKLRQRSRRAAETLAAALADAPDVPAPACLLALDLSSKCVGWSVFTHGDLSAYGKYLQRGAGHGEKLARFGPWLEALIRETHADVVILEQPFNGRNRNAYRVLLMYVAKVVELHWRRFHRELPPTCQIPPTTVKRLLKFPRGADHAANKRIAVEAINGLYDLDLTYKHNDVTKEESDDDIADAIALGRAYLLQHHAWVFA